MAHALILAAGLGTRLRPLSEELPKPLFPVGDASVLMHVARRLARAGFSRAAINTHWLPNAFAEEVAALPLEATCVHEPNIRGTGGGVAGMTRALGLEGDALVWNGDILIDLDPRALADAQRASNAIATLAVSPRPRGEGTVGVDERGHVVRLRGETFGVEVSGGDFVGVQCVGGELVASLPEEGCIVGDVYLPALRQGARVATFEAPREWDDIGTIEGYLAANARWLEGEGVLFCASSEARIDDGVELVESIVCRGASVVGRGELTRVVVWPAARATAPLADAVVTSRGVTRGRTARA